MLNKLIISIRFFFKDVPIPSGPRDQTSPRDGPFGARDVRPQIDPTDRLPQIDPPERLPPVGPRDRLPPIDEPFGPTDIAPEIDPRDSLQPINPTDRLPIDPRERLPQIDPRISLPQVDPEGSLRPFDSRDNLPPVEPREGFPQIGPGGRLPPVDPRGRLPNPGDRPVSPSGVMPPIPLPPIPRDPFDRNQETPISPYPKGEYILEMSLYAFRHLFCNQYLIFQSGFTFFINQKHFEFIQVRNDFKKYSPIKWKSKD